jgi:hypothetical protein
MVTNGFARTVALAAIAASCACACSTTATITNKDATRYNVAIVRSTPAELIVATSDGERGIPREQIAAIDHPGNVALVAGALMLFAGTANLLGVARCHANDSSGVCFGWAAGGAVAASGLGLTIWGASVWTASVRAAESAPGATLAFSF